MRRKIFALLISVVLMVTSVATVTFAEPASEIFQVETSVLAENAEVQETEEEPAVESTEAQETEETPVAAAEEIVVVPESTPEGTPLSGKIGNYGITDSGSYYLSGDATGNITVGSGATVTIDLNGYVLTGGASGSVITNNGILTVKDGDKTKVHYYTVGSDGLWTLNTEASEGTPYANLTERPDTGDVIAINGGAITGGVKGSLIEGSSYGVEGTIAVGGGIYSAGNLTIDGAVICGNTIDNNSGGRYMGMGIFCAGENCVLNDAIICGNSGVASTKSPEGGAIFSASTVSAEDSSFSFNTVSFVGGAIMLRDKQSKTGYYATLTMKNCTLQGNSASRGGAAELLGDENDAKNTVFTFENCTIDRNTAERDGGAIAITYGTLNITGGSVSNNTLTDDGVYFCSGGAIFDEAETNLKDVVIAENEAVRGGAIFLNQHNLTAENVTFSENEATGSNDSSSGGAIYVSTDSMKDEIEISLTSCEFSENSAGLDGGGVFFGCKSIAEITGGKITENTAGGTGGGLYIDAVLGGSTASPAATGKATLTGVEVSGNKAVNGGGVGMNASAQLLMNGCTVTGNSATETEVADTGFGGGIYKPGTYQQDKAEWPEKVVLLNTQITGNTATYKGGGVYFKLMEYETKCFAKGTIITMADGATKKVEDVVEGDLLKTFDHETGDFSSAPVYLAWQKENTGDVSSFKLYFEGGNSVQCIGGHDFLEKTSRKYQKLTAENAESYVGRSFFGEDGKWHELLSVSMEEAGDKSYCIYTAKHQNAFAGGMLSAPDDVDYLLNIYELDEDLKADEVQLAADIEEYGLTSYEYANEASGGITREWYEAAGTKYLFIAIGKGLITEEYAKELYANTVEVEAGASSASEVSSLLEGLKTVFRPLLSLFAPVEVYAAEAPKLEDFDPGYLYVGTGTVVTGNTVGSDQNNVFLEPSRKKVSESGDWERIESLIRVCDGATDMNIGVSVSETPTASAAVPVTTAENDTDYSEYFTSDNTAYNAYNRGLESEQQIVIGTEVARIVETSVYYGTVQAAVDAAANGQTVQMVADSTEDLTISKQITLDLNGKVLKGTGTDNKTSVISIQNGNLTITDSNPKAKHYFKVGTDAENNLWKLDTTATEGTSVFEMSSRPSAGDVIMVPGGIITGGSATQGGGINNAYNYKTNKTGTLIMKGGSIVGNKVSNAGGGIFSGKTSGTLSIESGCVIAGNVSSVATGGINAGTVNASVGAYVFGNTAKTNAGGIKVTQTTGITISGSVIGNKALRNGGGVYSDGNTDAPASLTISGNVKGNICGSGSYNGAGVYLETSSETLTLSGSAVITGNLKGTAENNLYLADATKRVVVSNPQSGMKIGVTTKSAPTAGNPVAITTAENAADYSGFFSSDNTNYAVINTGSGTTQQVVIGYPVAKIVETGNSYGTVQAAVDAAANGQTVQMITDSTENVVIGTKTDHSKVVTIDLNGKTLKSTGTVEGIRHNSISNYATLTIADSSEDGTGKITGGTGSVMGKGSYGGGVYNSQGTITMTGGTITGNSAGFGGGVANIKGTFTMTGGTITGNTSTGTGGGGVANIDGGSFIMTGGSITGNTASGTGGGVYNDATMSVSGTAKVTDNTKGTGETATKNNVFLTSGKTITAKTGSGADVKYLENGAAFGITTADVPTVAVPVAVTTAENAADYSEYFTSDDKTYSTFNTGSGNTQQVVIGYAVAKVVETGKVYSTVQAAVDAVKDSGYTIQMLNDSTENVSIWQDEIGCKVVLDLNGHILKASDTSVPVISVFSELTIKDSNKTASHTGEYEDLAGGLITGSTDGMAGIYIETGTLNMYGGTITGNAGSEAGGVYNSCGDFTMYGGSICNNSASGTEGGGGVQNDSNFTLVDGVISGNTYTVTFDNGGGGGVFNSGTFIMQGGSITKNEAKRSFMGFAFGGGVNNFSAGTFTMTGGSITDNMADVNGSGVVNNGIMNVSGTAKVTGNTKGTGETATANNVYLPDGKTITIGTGSGASVKYLEKGAAFGITTATAPGDGSLIDITGANSKDYSKFFTSDNADYIIINDGTGSNQVVKLAVHIHSWTYTLSEDGSTVTAACGGIGECQYTDTTLTINAPEDLEYDGTNKTAAFTETSFLGSSDLPEITYQYKATESGTYGAATNTKQAGYYKASFTVGSGDGAKTGYIEYSVSKKQLTLSGTQVQDKTYNGNATISCTVGTVSGIVENDKVTVGVASSATADKNVGKDKPVTVKFNVTGDDASNYIAPADNTSLKATISALQLEINGTEASNKTYDGTVAAQVTMGAYDIPVLGDDVQIEIDTAVFDDENVGTGKEVTVSYKLEGTDAGNYIEPEDENLTANITPKSISVQADDKTSYIGEDLEELTYTADSLIGEDTFSGELATDADKNVAGKYDITQGTLSAGDNYTISFTKGTYEVTDKKVQTLTFAGVSGGSVEKSYGDADFTETVSGAETTVTYSSSDPKVAKVDPVTGKVTILRAGSTIIKATAAESAEYAAGSAQYLLTVNKMKVAVPSATTGLVYNGKVQTGVVLPEDAPYTLTGNTAKAAGKYTAVASLTDKDNYEWDKAGFEDVDQNIFWSISGKAVTVTADNKSMLLGGAVPAFTAKVEGLIGSDTVKYQFKKVDVKEKGVYSIVPEGDANQGNYLVSYVQGILSVTTKDSPANVDAASLAKVLEKYRADEAYKNKDLAVEVRTGGTVPQQDIDQITAKVSKNKKITFTDTELYLLVTEDGVTEEENIGNDNKDLVGVIYKFDFTNKSDIQVFRAHRNAGGTTDVEEITEKPNANGEYFVQDKNAGTITVYAKKYSTYAFAYVEGKVVPGTGDNGSVLPWMLAILASLATLAGCVIKRRKNRAE